MNVIGRLEYFSYLIGGEGVERTWDFTNYFSENEGLQVQLLSKTRSLGMQKNAIILVNCK